MKTTNHSRHHKLSASAAYFESLREIATNLFRAAPFGLDSKEAKACAGVVLKAVQQQSKSGC